MREINIAHSILNHRREKGLTQDALASYIGVSKASVSKWETGQSYPDITLLPLLASFFNITVDELIGYEPQMTREDIRQLYKRLSSDFAEKPFDEVAEQCREIVKKYFSCFPLLLQIGALICDEPTSALDPIGRKEILDILLKIRGKTTVVFSTHILSDVEKICDRIAVLHNGTLALHGTLAEIKKRRRSDGFVIEFSSAEDTSAFERLEELRQPSLLLTREENTLSITTADIDAGGHLLLDLLAKSRVVPLKFAAAEPTLERLFEEVVQ